MAKDAHCGEIALAVIVLIAIDVVYFLIFLRFEAAALTGVCLSRSNIFCFNSGGNFTAEEEPVFAAPPCMALAFPIGRAMPSASLIVLIIILSSHYGAVTLNPTAFKVAA